MEGLFALPFSVLEIPNIKIKKPTWLQTPSAMTTFSLVLLSYFLVTGGIIYDVIVEPPSVGSTTDEHGHSRPVAFMPNRVNGQYIMEGLAASFLFSLGGLGFIILDMTHNPSTPKLNRILLISVAFICILVSFFTTWIFMRMKLPGYLQN
ncbi:Oligosaccharyltransferase complex subunit ostc-A-like protein [Operophtera brumata]|uniref:Oligosaccharyltransferase complex subunit n=1 Tax=Operophtera brumata TaxID=104452 RepID=A0A0L7LG98_OPEBR|nr:Oligosaccharyltransferase complex subunit ostc-A-like protein [Operophtera brumata]